MQKAYNVSTPYQKHRHYFKTYHKRYWRTHPEYRERQRELKRERYRTSKEADLQRVKRYVSSIYDKWLDGRSRTFMDGVAVSAKSFAVERILPREGFKKILWAAAFHPNKTAYGAFWVFDAFAFKAGRPCAVQITTSPFKQNRKPAEIAAFLKFFGLNLYVCTVKPDLAKYYLSRFDADHVPRTVSMTFDRLNRMKRI
jgi:hypothetical protein